MHTPVSKQAIAAKQKGANNSNHKGAYICSFKRYETATAAAGKLKVSHTTITRRCNNPKWKLKGWYFLEEK